ncbi:MAG: hypothetical protein ACRCYH_08970 [Clostridium chrysemydis]
MWQDSGLIELKITAISEFVKAYQNCYIADEDLEEIAKKIKKYSKSYDYDCYVEFAKKKGNYTPAFSMKVLKADDLGKMKIEVDIEVEDIKDRSHRCCYYVEGDLGAIERLGKNLKNVIKGDIGYKISLYSDEI